MQQAYLKFLTVKIIESLKLLQVDQVAENSLGLGNYSIYLNQIFEFVYT